MDSHLTDATLRDGRAVRVLCIQAPAGAWADQIARFLGHKWQPWSWQIRKHVAAQVDRLESRFFVIADGDALLSHISTYEFAGMGILGHVYTDPACRSQGAASILMRAVCADFQARGGVVMHLGTRYDSPPWRIYARYGFKGVCPPKGLMRWAPQSAAYDAAYSPGPVRVRSVQWHDWPTVQALMLRTEGDWLRSRTLGAYGHGDCEESFVRLMGRIEQGDGQGWTLTNEADVAVGFASLTPFADVPSDACQLDLYVAPNVADRAAQLLAAVRFPSDRQVVAHLDGASVSRIGLLTGVGFRESARFAGLCRAGDRVLDLVTLIRR